VGRAGSPAILVKHGVPRGVAAAVTVTTPTLRPETWRVAEEPSWGGTALVDARSSTKEATEASAERGPRKGTMPGMASQEGPRRRPSAGGGARSAARSGLPASAHAHADVVGPDLRSQAEGRRPGDPEQAQRTEGLGSAAEGRCPLGLSMMLGMADTRSPHAPSATRPIRSMGSRIRAYFPSPRPTIPA